MTSMYGADVEQLRALATQFDRSADRLDADRVGVGNEIRVKAWVGPVAVRFRAQWDSDHSRRMHDAAERLRSAALSLRANADDQARTSAVGSGGSAVRVGTGDRPGSSAETQAPRTLAEKWLAMTSEDRERLPLNRLAVFGYTDSLPASVRDEANRLLLERYTSQICPAGPPAAVEKYVREMTAYRQVEQVLRAHTDAQLLLLDPGAGSQVHVAISLGDVETADNVAVYTQGWTSGADKEGGLVGPVAEINDLRDAVHGQLAAQGRGSESTAMVIWMGYDAPQNQGSIGDAFGIANAQQPQYAEAGARQLAAFAEGIRAQNPDAHIAAIGHSYGSYVTGLAAQQTTALDSIVVFGSPGVGAHDLSQLNVGGEFYVVEAPGDLVADSAQFGKDPSEISGAHLLPTDQSIAEWVDGHRQYLRDGSLSQRGIAHAITGSP